MGCFFARMVPAVTYLMPNTLADPVHGTIYVLNKNMKDIIGLKSYVNATPFHWFQFKSLNKCAFSVKGTIHV